MDRDISIKVDGVSKIYNLYEKPSDRLKEAMSIGHKSKHREHYALNNISFEVKRGETFGIIGTNGAGKSTLLKLITGVATPNIGMIYVDGKIAALLELGAGFNMEYTGVENIYLNGTMMGYTREEMKQKIAGVVEFADIGEFINQPVKNYSSGMFARLAFAVAINVEPEILIVDEALSVGDVFFQNKCYRKFEELRAKNTTVIFVSHDIGSVRQMCSRVLWIEKGIQQMVGSTKEVCDSYSNARIQESNEYNKKNATLGEDTNILEVNKAIETLENVPLIMQEIDGTLSEDAEILSIFVTDADNEIATELITDRYYSINFVSRFYKDMDRVLFGFTMENIKGVKILGNNTYAKEKLSYSVKRDEMYYTAFQFQMPKIETGNYLISPAIALGTQETPIILVWLNSACQVRIERPGYNLSFVDVDYTFNIKKINTINLV